jgi:hypothetical protein
MLTMIITSKVTAATYVTHVLNVTVIVTTMNVKTSKD